VDAYIDHSNPDGLSGDEYRASVTAPGVFDRVYDVDAEPLASQTQSMAAITQIFYTVNWMHDWWYDSGFDEAAGNAQADNYGRGGVEGDVLHAEAQDAALLGARNNANMSTPADGESPRMQMYLWTGPSEASLSVTPLAQDFTVSTAAFGPKDFDVSALITVIDDGNGTLSDGCQPAVNDLVGRIALVDRGSCTFETKSTNALAAGAVGVLIANNQNGNTPPNLGNDNNLPDPQIPTLGITKAAGDAIKAALQNLPQTGHMLRLSSVERDGTIDNMIVAHEWGHYIHHRLVDCGNQACGAESEGWGDFMALHLSLREGDDLDGVYAVVTYASLDPSAYYGLRRVPYSVDPTKNALSFRHIQNGEALPASHPLKANGIANSEVHNAGEIWTTMLWESYVALHKAHEGELSFDEVRRRMSDYVVAGMILAPSAPTFTEQRDAILAAIAASSQEDFLTVAGAFAKRGAGTCAISPPKASTDLIGVVEDFELRARGTITSAAVSDNLLSCDDDGVVDVDELGELTVGIRNVGAAPIAAGAILEVVDPDPSLVFPDGASLMLPEIAPQEELLAALTVAVDDALVDHLPLTLTLRLSGAGGCDETIERLLPIVVNGDVLVESSKIDDVEAPATAWSVGGDEGDAIWSRQVGLDGHHWHGDDVGRKSDTWIMSPQLKVAADEPLVISLEHAYSFEFSDNTYWDGGVIEVSLDDGATWQDVVDYVDPGYPGTINSGVNPLDKRPAFVGDNPSYPDMDPLVLDLGMALAGESARVRLRIGTDGAAGGAGWDIDNIAFAGIVNTPFDAWIADQGICAVDTDTDTDTGGTDSGGTDSSGTDSG
ncbi:MAG: M36 family metallopeptidase, partial [Myxococcales bacterium]|nr:M36 family metallopeptidase [Myxococcales bacterium]